MSQQLKSLKKRLTWAQKKNRLRKHGRKFLGRNVTQEKDIIPYIRGLKDDIFTRL